MWTTSRRHFSVDPYTYHFPTKRLVCGSRYHLWALVGTANVFRHTGDKAWLSKMWAGHTRGVEASLAKVNRSSGLMVVDQTADWARGGQVG